jgi:hypothetical protein
LATWLMAATNCGVHAALERLEQLPLILLD